MPAPVSQEWLNQNSHRNYPFREDTSLVPAEAADVTLPNYLFVDWVLTTAGDTDIDVRLSRLSFVGGFLSCVFVDDDDNTVTTLAVDTNTHTTYDGYSLTGQDDYDDARGVAVLGDLTRLTTDLPDGAYTFTSAYMEHCTIRPALRGVRSVRVGLEDTLSDFIRGHIKLVEGTNIQFTYLPDSNAIRVDALGSGGYVEDCDCADTYARPQAVRTVNGVNAEDVQIVGDGRCVEVDTSGNQITIRDTCSAPCCGCPELELLTKRLELQESVLRRVEEYAIQLQEKIDNTINAMLASTKGG